MSSPPDGKPRIIMDERERGSIREALQKLDCELIIETLDFGDYILADDVAIERKRGDDLVTSIFDTRFFDQLSKLKHVFANPMLLLEGAEKMFNRPFVKESAVYGAISYAAHKMKIPIVPTVDEDGTAQFIYACAIEVQKKRGKPDLAKIPQLSADHFEPSHADQIYFLEGLLDTGPATAELLLNCFGTPFNVLHAIDSTEIIYDVNGKPKDIKGLLQNVRGIGPVYVQKNQELLQTMFTGIRLKKSRKKSVIQGKLKVTAKRKS
jgi:ERCC4-type nuclease